jgi:hypothetical protein
VGAYWHFCAIPLTIAANESSIAAMFKTRCLAHIDVEWHPLLHV